MTVLAAVFMGVALISVTALAAWCYYRVLRSPEKRDPDNG